MLLGSIKEIRWRLSDNAKPSTHLNRWLSHFGSALISVSLKFRYTEIKSRLFAFISTHKKNRLFSSIFSSWSCFSSDLGWTEKKGGSREKKKRKKHWKCKDYVKIFQFHPSNSFPSQIHAEKENNKFHFDFSSSPNFSRKWKTFKVRWWFSPPFSVFRFSFCRADFNFPFSILFSQSLSRSLLLLSLSLTHSHPLSHTIFSNYQQ